MKDYTIIYTESHLCGSHQNTITCMKRVRTNNLKKLVGLYGCGQIVYIFEGHPKVEGEEGGEKWLIPEVNRFEEE